ncbi:hypothetical protein J7T55_007265 [Diaporthe amygdali]|uniref:uncharacterized protein n=1 Tax=Phomopsis amygdali TaxID=1214568 RepID=UPI0022FE3E03|nr:uncharacterized protein J7T55_007265 [Diaporthe amygdali]KAJ0108146.1 hypothetical protein J7T55_007265 [Diaporthe amygdali]
MNEQGKEGKSGGEEEVMEEEMEQLLGGDQFLFMATYYTVFPVLAREVECGAAALEVVESLFESPRRSIRRHRPLSWKKAVRKRDSSRLCTLVLDVFLLP